jgi:probable rRNA maturation factor
MMNREETRIDLPRITVRNAQRAVRVNIGALQESAAKALRLCLSIRSKQPTALSTLREIHVMLVSDRRMAALHRRFLKQSGPTDVITFEHGEIFISAETARRQAKQFGNPLFHELQLYVVHGLLHLHDFDDRSDRDRRRMKAMQEKILKKL